MFTQVVLLYLRKAGASKTKCLAGEKIDIIEQALVSWLTINIWLWVVVVEAPTKMSWFPVSWIADVYFCGACLGSLVVCCNSLGVVRIYFMIVMWIWFPCLLSMVSIIMVITIADAEKSYKDGHADYTPQY